MHGVFYNQSKKVVQTFSFLAMSKCRGLFNDLSLQRKQEVESKCKSTDFSSSFMIVPESVLEQQIRSKLKEEVDIAQRFELLKQNVCKMETIVANDAKLLRKKGVSCTQVADVLKTLMRIALYKKDVYWGGDMLHHVAKVMGTKEVTEPTFFTPFGKIVLRGSQWSDQGAQECPFKDGSDRFYHGYKYGARDVVVTNTRSGKFFKFSSLLPHMIKHHGFFEGPLCHYRLEVKDVIEVVGRLTQNASYRIPSKKTEKTDAAGKVQVVKDFEWSKFLPGAPDGPFDKVVTDLFGARVVVLTK